MVTIECCGNSVSTPFCPYCGKPIGGESTLLNFLVSNRAGLLKKRDMYSERLENKDLPRHKIYAYTNHVKTLDNKICRVSEWIDWIKEKIEN